MPSVGEIAQANTHGGLTVVTMWGRWSREIQSTDAIGEVQLQFAVSFASLLEGYSLSRILLDLRDQTDRSFAEATRLCRILADFPSDASYLRAGRDAQALALVEASSVNALPGSVLGRHFNQHRPTLQLQRADQGLLRAALDGAVDETVAQRLKLSLPAVKRRWAALYARLEASNLHDFSNPERAENGARGLQKRHRILSFVREHPEELRPTLPLSDKPNFQRNGPRTTSNLDLPHKMD